MKLYRLLRVHILIATILFRIYEIARAVGCIYTEGVGIRQRLSEPGSRASGTVTRARTHTHKFFGTRIFMALFVHLHINA